VSNYKLRLTHCTGKLLEFDGPADITQEESEAIVNAANSSLLGGGGVDGAIHRAGGPAILEECRQIVAQISRLPAGQAVITTGGRLKAKHVIHTVGPIYRDHDNDAETLAGCYRESIRLAEKHGLQSISFPSISTGAFGYPVHDAAAIAIASVFEELESATSVRHFRFVLFDVATLNAYTRAAEKLLQRSENNSYTIMRAS
jgi:O-acetyl-ADP-ribose deacetylase (regulator of RNase III)